MAKKILSRVGAALLLIAVLLLAGAAVAGVMSVNRIAAVKSVKKLEDGLYTMEYDGDYGFDRFLQKGGAASDQGTADYVSKYLTGGAYRMVPVSVNSGCSTIAGTGRDGHALFGRNYDWSDCTTLVMRTKPTDGYESVATCNMDFLGYGNGYVPDSLWQKYLAIGAIYMPVDGMNEKGLCVADLIIRTDERTEQNTGKTNITTATAIRLLLDKAWDVRSALDLLYKYDMHGSENLMHHLAISDAQGNSVVVEYVDNVMYVTQTPIVTNFYLTEGDHYGIGSDQSKKRYAQLSKIYSSGLNTDAAQMMNALESVNQARYGEDSWMTEWSIVYDQHDLNMDFCFREHYDRPYYRFSVR